MPAYQCASPTGMLTETMKSQVAEAITDAHVKVAGGPREFVHVFFVELPYGAAYTAGRIDTQASMISGTIRIGRTVEVKQQLIKTVAAAWSTITAQPLAHLVVAIAEINPEVVMEYGVFLPAPGDEAEWFATNSGALQGISVT